MGTSLGVFRKLDEVNPILGYDPEATFECPFAGTVHWAAKDVFNAGAIVRDGRVHLLFRAEDSVGRYAGTSRIGLAVSEDGIHFTRHPKPVLFPDDDDFAGLEWEGGCEDPRIVEAPDGSYVITYTAYDGRTARLCIATSTDLYTWRKHGRAFRTQHPDLWSKSGAIITELVDGRPIATRIQGKYWMIWGESSLFAATSDNLIEWQVVSHVSEVGSDQRDMASGHAVVLRARRGRPDSSLVEPGPPPILADGRVIQFYAGRNSPLIGDPEVPEGRYAAFEAHLDPVDPLAVVYRAQEPFLIPDQPFEIEGQVQQVVFPEGLVRHHDRWFLYYGTADSHIGVAATDPGEPFPHRES